MPLTTPVTLTLKIHLQSFGVVCQTFALGAPTPALLHRTWRRAEAVVDGVGQLRSPTRRP